MVHAARKKQVRCSENMKRAYFVSADVVCVKGWAVGGSRTGKTSLSLCDRIQEARQHRIQHYMASMPARNPNFVLANNIGAEQPAHPRSLINAFTLSKSSNWSSLQTGHPLYLIVAKSMKDIILKVCIFYSKALLTRLPD